MKFRLSNLAASLAIAGFASVAMSSTALAAPAKKGDKAWKETVSEKVAMEIRAWKNSQSDLPTIRDVGGIKRYAFGHVTPEIVCAPLHVCTIRLQAGEKIVNAMVGDSTRWILSPAKFGQGETETPMVVLKPTETGINTNLIVTTTRHVYNLVLNSVANAGTYDSLVGFYWPDEVVQAWNQTAETEAAAEAEEEDRTVGLPNVSVDKLDFKYAVEMGDGANEWMKPVRVFDDGQKVYIQMSDDMKNREAPVLFEINKDGSEKIVNYRLKGTYYVVDRLFDEAALIIGVDSNRKLVRIKRGNQQKNLFGGLFGG
jgi:P-type conjugative transfer protein TrbG